MARFIDEIIRGASAKTREALRQAVVVDARNVSDYFFSVSDQEHWQFDKDFPNLAPPFPNMFMEFRAPQFIRSAEHGITPWDLTVRPQQWGVHIQSVMIPDEYRQDSGVPKWVMTCHLYESVLHLTHLGRVTFEPYFSWIIPVMSDGSVYQENGKPMTQIGSSLARNDEDLFNVADAVASFYQCAFLTIAFMHCKNVAMNEIVPSKALQKKAIKHHKYPLVRYHTIEIEPMKKILHTEGAAGSKGLQHALHICRGHFKNFSDKGLFGKYHGMYWWESHIRGNKEQGIVIPDYEVKQPKDAA